MKIYQKTQNKIDVVKAWVEKNGQIWSRKVLYVCVTAGLTKDTSQNSWSNLSKLFTRLRLENPDIVSYDLFQDKKMTESNVGIESDIKSFDDYFKIAIDTYKFARDSKTLQKAYVEIFTEKDLPNPVENLLSDYEVGLISSKGFGGDVALFRVLERLKNIKEKFNLPVKFYCLGDYDPEGEYIIEKIKKRYEPFGIDIKKLAITKQQIIDLSLPSNLEFRAKMNKPKTKKSHLNKKYVKKFFELNKDICPPDGKCQYELEGIETDYLLNLIKKTIHRHIDIKKINNSRETFQQEAENWIEKHYKI